MKKSTLQEEPISSYLMDGKNIIAVLEVLRHGIDIREKLAFRFWKKLKESRPALNIEVDFKEDSDNKVYAGLKADESVGLDVRLNRGSAGLQNAQGLKYRIEVGRDYFGFGLAWLDKTKNYAKLWQLPPVQKLQSYLKPKKEFSLITGDEKWWLSWKYWDKNLYPKPYPDIWSRFAGGFDDDKAIEFWDFVGQTTALVSEANKALRRS